MGPRGRSGGQNSVLEPRGRNYAWRLQVQPGGAEFRQTDTQFRQKITEPRQKKTEFRKNTTDRERRGKNKHNEGKQKTAFPQRGVKKNGFCFRKARMAKKKT